MIMAYGPLVLVDKKTVVTIDNVKFCDSGQSLILLSGATLNPFSESPRSRLYELFCCSLVVSTAIRISSIPLANFNFSLMCARYVSIVLTLSLSCCAI